MWSGQLHSRSDFYVCGSVCVDSSVTARARSAGANTYLRHKMILNQVLTANRHTDTRYRLQYSLQRSHERSTDRSALRITVIRCCYSRGRRRLLRSDLLCMLTHVDARARARRPYALRHIYSERNRAIGDPS